MTADLASGAVSGEGADRLSSIEDLVGTKWADRLKGDDRNNRIWAGTGRDTVIGRAGDDILKGEGGPDHLYGKAGDDKLIGGGGHDHLNGGPGNDTCLSGELLNACE